MRTGVAIALYLAVTLMLAAFAGGCTLSSYGKLRRHSLARSRSLVFRLTAVGLTRGTGWNPSVFLVVVFS